jgi:Emfourin
MPAAGTCPAAPGDAGNPMKISKIRFRQSGGFAGLVRGCEVAPEDLGAADRRALEGHAQARSAAAPAGSSPARDLAFYEIELETDAGVSRLEFDEQGVPDDLAALVERLVKSSRPMRP